MNHVPFIGCGLIPSQVVRTWHL